jgi:hypothetical protein
LASEIAGLNACRGQADFYRVDVRYQQPLYEAVSEALMRRPNAGFGLVAVAPFGGSATVALSQNVALHNADQTPHALVAMGLTADRVSLLSVISPKAHFDEVRLYVRWKQSQLGSAAQPQGLARDCVQGAPEERFNTRWQ